MSSSRRLPTGRWWRALFALGGYLLTVAVGAAGLTTIIGGTAGLPLSLGLAVLLLVPLAVVVVAPREPVPGPHDHLPVLARPIAGSSAPAADTAVEKPAA